MTQKSQVETEINIVKLDYPDNIRTRPEMYFGALDNGNVALREIVDNSIDELFNSHKATKIVINKIVDFYLVADNGRGIPIKLDEKSGLTKADLAMSSVHAGSKFNKTEVAVGMNGVGASVCNALSEEFIVLSKITHKNWNKSIDKVLNKVISLTPGVTIKERTDLITEIDSLHLYYCVVYNKGIKKYEGCLTLEDIEKEMKFEIGSLPREMSTLTFFKLDETIFESTKANFPKRNLINSKLVFEKFRNKKVTFEVFGQDIEDDMELYKYEATGRIDVEKKIQEKFRGDEDRITWELNKAKNKWADFYINFEFSEDLSSRSYSGSVNSLVTNSGFHVTLVTQLITNTLKKFFNISHNHISEGLQVFVVALAAEPSFSGQTKENLSGIPGIKLEDQVQLESIIVDLFKANKAALEIHIERLNEYAASVDQIAAIDKVKQLVNISSEKGNKARSFVPKNVFEASSPNRKDCELYLVEGKSAGGTLVMARNASIHAILSLKGKPMNSVNASYEDLLNNSEMNDLVATIGAGLNIYNNLDNPRYGKVILASDSDPDGAAISALLLGAIGYHMTFLIDAGMVFIADNPLYFQNGKYIYATDDIDKELNKSKPYQRFKGLGEMNPSQLKITMLDPATRRLLKVTREGFDDAMKILTSSNRRRLLMEDAGILIDKYYLAP